MHQIKDSHGQFDGINSLTEYIFKTCNQHRKENRALAFALIVYDFHNPHVEKMLEDKAYYNALDHVSGKFLTIFYINSNYLTYQSKIAAESNKVTLELSIQKVDTPVNVSPKLVAHKIINQETLPSPSILFFNVKGSVITEYTIANLRENEVEKGFNELIKIVELAVGGMKDVQEGYKDNHDEIFDLLKQTIEGAEFWKSTKSNFKKMMKLRSFFSFFSA